MSAFLHLFSKTFLFLLLVCGVAVLPQTVAAEEVIITNPVKSSDDKRFDYPMALLRAAMERTVDHYGPFRIERYPTGMSRKRALQQLMSGNPNVFEAPTRLEWEASAIPIRIPIRKGLLGYRLLLIRDVDQDIFSGVNSIDDLKKYRMGGGAQWSTTMAVRRLGFTVYGGAEYEPLFSMLMGKRFDYFPRGVNEVFAEFDTRKAKFPTMRIEKTVALYLPLPTYFFVTPKRPDLAKRLTQGLLSMVDDGSLDKMFEAYHGPSIERANLKNRRIIELKNLNLTDETPFHRKDFWIDPKK